MTEPNALELIQNHRGSDHARGCQGRAYACSCGHNVTTTAVLARAETEIASLRAQLAEANKKLAMVDGTLVLERGLGIDTHATMVALCQKFAAREIELKAQLASARKALDWVESWVHNPVGSYSVAALDGLFAMTRDRISALTDEQGTS